MIGHPPTSSIHVFERAGLGRAPFTYLGWEIRTYQACPGAPIQPGSSCDFCATGIKEVHLLRSADGKLFKVGCDCIRKSGDGGLRRALSAASKAKAEARKAREEQRIELARAAFDANPTPFESNPHPYPDRTARGERLSGFVSWMFLNAGHTGRLKAARIVEKILCKEGIGK